VTGGILGVCGPREGWQSARLNRKELASLIGTLGADVLLQIVVPHLASGVQMIGLRLPLFGFMKVTCQQTEELQ
jgi:hypothetical protein